MKKLLLFVFAITISTCIFAQISEGGMPRSFLLPALKSKATISSFTLPALDTTALLQYDNNKSAPFRYGVVKNVSIDLKSLATKTNTPDGGTLWRYKIESENDKSIGLFFSTYIVPDGAELYLYNEDYTVVKGAFTSINMRDDQEFTIGDFPGKYTIVEYYEPVNVTFEGSLIISSIGEAYIDIFGTKSKNTDSDGFIGVNCDEGKNWQEQKHSVLRYTFNDGTYSYLCSGALINNTTNDAKSYFLTANHCISTNAEALTVTAYFNYENPACLDTYTYTSQTITGARLETTGAQSDYTLLKFKSSIPSSYKPYYSGWDCSGTPSENSTGIHHPHGYKKRISIDNDPSVSYAKSITWEGGSITPADTHWQVTFDEGVTASGSSGSPLYNQNHRIIGQLHGGDNIYDYYGKISYSFTLQSSSDSTLNLFLDPTSSGVTTLDGYYPTANHPDPQFLSDFSSVCVGSAINISGFSAFAPATWNWSFSPSTISFSNGTDATSQNPDVTFNAAGSYAVSLITSNAAGKDSLKLSNFITAGTSLSLEVYPSGLSDSCLANFTSVNLQAYGADAYLWTLSEESANYFYIEDNTTNPAVIKLKDGVSLTSSLNIKLTLLGTQGTCESSISYSLPLTAQGNDDISNAIKLSTGKNGAFSNVCATVETGEPAPPVTSCTGQLSWCDELNQGSASLDNTVWFYYVPDYDQITTFYSKGIDNQIAIYKAATYSDVMNGNYELVGANDDYSSTDANPKITSLSLTANQPYWIQVDGSAGGVTGYFYLYVLIISSGINDLQGIAEEINVYPQPACDYVNIASDAFTGSSEVLVELFSASGTKVYTEKYSDGTSILTIPTTNLSSGMYLARITCDGKRSTVKIIK